MTAPIDPNRSLAVSPPALAFPSAPLTWWRTLPPESLDLTAQRHLRAVLVAAPPLPLPGWDAAIRADPAAAIGVALTILAEGVARPGSLDRALSAVLVCAALGDPACRDLLVHVLGRRARRRADLDALRLARRWRGWGHQGSASVIAPGR
ncbi:hypothetical protein [Methylobacterium sp.]|uniref:hypothetical protein n=1 Tax=Methylobacterium sp. TaxID=409 RepID=UPI0025EFB799|nr:hypothetical protein [Methylobacterium sp.]MBY0260455.1 hypothetical protein [Methylobacterium sp.]